MSSDFETQNNVDSLNSDLGTIRGSLNSARNAVGRGKDLYDKLNKKPEKDKKGKNSSNRESKSKDSSSKIKENIKAATDKVKKVGSTAKKAFGAAKAVFSIFFFWLKILGLIAFGIFFLFMFIINSLPASGFNEVFDIAHKARDQEIMDLTLSEGEKVAQTKEQTRAGLERMIEEVLDKTGLGSTLTVGMGGTNEHVESIFAKVEDQVIDTKSDDSITRPVSGGMKLPDDFVPPNLIEEPYSVDGVYYDPVSNENKKIRKEALDAFTLMAAAITKESNLHLQIVSAYRSMSLQKSLYMAVQDGSVGAPGYSEHHTGLAIDLWGTSTPVNIDASGKFENTKEYKWLKDNAQRFGFTETMPMNTTWTSGWEPWHWRYVGIPLATEVKNAQDAGKCTSWVDWVENGKTVSGEGLTAPTESYHAPNKADGLFITCAYDLTNANYLNLMDYIMDDQTSILDKVGSVFNRGLADFLHIDSAAHYNRIKQGVFSSEIILYEEEFLPTVYDTYSPKTIDGKKYYLKTGTALTSKKIDVDGYGLVGLMEDGTPYYEKSGKVTIYPNRSVKDTGKREEVEGVSSKVAVLKILGLEPYDTYSKNTFDEAKGLSNLEYAEYLYKNTTEYLYDGAYTNGSTAGLGSLIWPVPSQNTPELRARYITSLIGNRDSPGGIGSTDHHGTDIAYAGGMDRTVVAAIGGTVTQSGWYGGYGYAVTIKTDDLNGEPVEILYGHLDHTLVRTGQVVNQGDKIGIGGSTGNSTGPHLHFEIRLSDGTYGNALAYYSESYLKGFNPEYGVLLKGKLPPEPDLPTEVLKWKNDVIKALRANDITPTTDIVNKILTQIFWESSGDEKAVQSDDVVDVNSLSGNHARGLMQTIPTTFEYYKHKGHNDIFNGYDNLLAAINYIKNRYDDPWNYIGTGNKHGY